MSPLTCTAFEQAERHRRSNRVRPVATRLVDDVPRHVNRIGVIPRPAGHRVGPEPAIQGVIATPVRTLLATRSRQDVVMG